MGPRVFKLCHRGSHFGRASTDVLTGLGERRLRFGHREAVADVVDTHEHVARLDALVVDDLDRGD